MKVRFFQSISIIIVIVTISIVTFLLFFLNQTQAQKVKYDIAGWFWGEDYGWISLNSDNADLLGLPASQPYKLTMENDQITGWGWSSNVGWICFGQTCDPNYICDNVPAGNSCNPLSFGSAVPAGGWKLVRNASTKALSGWAKVVSLKDSGWLHLGEGVVTSPGQVGVDCYDCSYDTSTPPNITGCNTCFTRAKFDGVNLPEANLDSVIGGSGNICFDCLNCRENISSDQSSFRVDCSVCGNCRLYGGVTDNETGGIIGWGWNGNEHPSDPVKVGTEGAGWVQFNALGGESGVVYPWLQTLYGAVFSRNKIRQKTVISGVNATYCIFAKDVYNFKSGSCGQNISTIDIKFPQQNQADQSYKNVLGRLDLLGLSSKTKLSNSVYYNKYNNPIVELAGNQIWNESSIFNNKVYLINGNLTLASGFAVNNAGAGEQGNGLVIINGDLIINSDFDYNNSNIFGLDLKQLASVAWVVKGDVLVAPEVRRIVGAFLVLGASDNCLYADGSPCSTPVNYPKYLRNQYGVFFSGESDSPLTVSGLIIAKAFEFSRTYSDIKQGSERIIYDGRLIANPPPGLKSFLESLPVIRDFEF